MVRELYTELATALSGVSGIKHVDLWNRNVEFLEEDEAFDMPAAFIEFDEVSWMELSGSTVSWIGRGKVNIHVVSRWDGSAAVGSDTQEEMLSVFDLLPEVQKVVSGVNASHWGRFRLETSTTNHDHEDVIDNVETYSFRIERTLA